MKIRLWVLLVLPLALSTQADDSVDPGVEYFLQGDYDLAAEQWMGPANEGDVVAQHNMGVLSRDGLGSAERDPNKAAVWFLRSAQQGYVPAMVSLAEVQTALGQEAAAHSWLTLAARWGSKEAIEHLEVRGLPVPEADLYANLMEKRQLEQMRNTGELLRPPIRKIKEQEGIDMPD